MLSRAGDLGTILKGKVLRNHVLFSFKQIKGTDDVISSDPPFKKGPCPILRISNKIFL